MYQPYVGNRTSAHPVELPRKAQPRNTIRGSNTMSIDHQPAAGNATPVPSTPDNGLGTAGMVVGIVAACFAFIPIIGMIAFVLAPLAIVLGIIGYRRTRGPQPTATNSVPAGFGIGLGVFALAVSFLWLVLFSAAVVSVDNELKDPNSDLSRSIDEMNRGGAELEAYSKCIDKAKTLEAMAACD